MRKPRFLLPPGGIYHVSIHALDMGTPYPFTDQEKERMRRLLSPMSTFTGVGVLSYAFMGNHVHMLLEVPERPDELNERTLVQRLNALPKAPSARRKPGDQLAHELSILRQRGGSVADVEVQLDRVRARMYDLSRFMQEYLARYTQDYNRRHERKGTLWEERFHSTAIQSRCHTLLTVAAYIDLNPLRAGLCTDPKDYRFTGYAAALGGDPFALKGLRRLFQLCGIQMAHTSEKRPLAAYRLLLYGEASQARSDKATLPSLERDRVKAVGGELGLKEVLKHRHRYLTRGGILGTRIFVEDQLTRWKEKCRLRKAPPPQKQDSLKSLHYGHPLQTPL